MNTWHVILNAENLVLAVYGAALEDKARAKYNEVNRDFVGVFFKTVQRGKRPKVNTKL